MVPSVHEFLHLGVFSAESNRDHSLCHFVSACIANFEFRVWPEEKNDVAYSKTAFRLLFNNCAEGAKFLI